MKTLSPRSALVRRWPAVVGIACCLTQAGRVPAANMVESVAPETPPSIVIHPVAFPPHAVEAITDESPDEGQSLEAGYDLARFFPDLRMVPILAATVVAGDTTAPDTLPGCRDFAAIVEEAKREALVAGRSGKGSVAARLPDTAPRRGTPATFASHARPTCRHHGHRGRPQAGPSCPPVQPGMPQEASPQRSATEPRVPGPALAEPGMTQPAPALDSLVPPVDAQADAVVPALPEVQQALPPARSLARADVGGQRANWSDAPFLIGDGGGPMQTGGKFSLGRIMIEAPGPGRALL